MAQLSLLVLFLLLLSFTLYVYRARSSHRVNRWFALFSFSISLWVLSISNLQSGRHLDAWGALAFSAAAFIPACFIAFIHVFPDGSNATLPLPLVVPFILAGVFALLASTTNSLVFDTVLSSTGLTRKTGAAYPFFSLYLFASWAFALSLLVNKWRKAHGQSRAQLQYLSLGLLLSVSTAMFLNLLLPLFTGRSTLSWLGPYSSLILLALVAHSIIRHRLLDLRLAIHRGSAYAALILFALSVVVTLGRFSSPPWRALPIGSKNDLLAALFVTLFLLTPVPLRLLTLIVDTYLLRPRMDSAALLTSAARNLAHLMQPNDLVSEFHRTLDSALAVRWSAIKLHSLDRVLLHGSLERLPPGVDLDGIFNCAADLLEPVDSAALHLVDPDREPSRLRPTAQALRAAGVDVLATLGRHENPLGLFVLGPKRNGDAYFSSDLSFLEALRDMVSIAVENALLYRHKLSLLDYANRLIESLDSAVITITQNATIDRANTAATSLLGILSTSPAYTIANLPSEVAWALVLTLSRGLRLRNVELSLDTASGTVPVLISTAVLSDEQGTAAGALAVLTDLSATKELERQRRRAEHLDTMARFYAGIAHEIRTPLTAISSFVSMLPDRFNDPEYRAAAVRLLPNEVTRIVRLADRLRLLAPTQDADLVPLNLAPLLADATLLHRSVASERGVTMSLRCPPCLPNIQGDRALIAQLLANLLRNAIDAMPAGGDLLLEAFAAPEGPTPRRVTLRVVDSGPGIDPSLGPRILEPFVTTKASGTGLGLTLCQKIAETHGASLALLPRRDRTGTVAEVTFSTAPTSLSSTEAPAERLDARAT